MSRSLAALVYGRTPTRTEARASISSGRRPGPPTMYGLPVSPRVREDAAMPAILTRAPRSVVTAASTIVAPHWFDDRTFADLVADAPTDMGALVRSSRR